MRMLCISFNPEDSRTNFKNTIGVGKTMLEQEIDGVPHVLVPKDAWDKIWEVLEKIEKIGE